MTAALERGGTPLRDAFSVTIADVTIAIRSSAADLALEVLGPARYFVDSAAEPDIRLHAAWSAPDDPVLGAKLFDSGGVWQLFRDGTQLAFHLSSPRFGPVPYKTATFSEDFSTGVVHLRRSCFETGRPIYPLEYPLDELLVTNWLALGRGVEVHACGVVDRDGKGYLFAGHSGAGKTTMARQWCDDPGVTVLSDDRIVLRRVGNDIWMHGTPWHGDEPLAAHACAPLTRGFFLRHAGRDELTDVRGAQAVARLLACSFPPFYSARAMDFTVSFLSDISRLAPFAELGFVPQRAIRDFIRAT